ncbi:hypothetical protein NUSPORA_00649 [Nucleospora cyclopteri]
MARYVQGKKIGSGTYAKVYEAMDTELSRTVALKKITLNEQEGMPSTALREISILKNLSHKNIVELYQVIHREDFLIMVMEYIDFELLDYIKNKGNVYTLINQLIKGIYYMHFENIIHRDLKPGNILVNKWGELKIADFGLSRAINLMDVPYSAEVITLWYRPPELLEGATSYGFEVDIWSLGCIIYEMVALKPLLPGDDKESQTLLCKNLNLIKLNEELKNVYKVPEIYRKIIVKCLNKSPKRRICAEEIMAILDKDFKKQNIGW